MVKLIMSGSGEGKTKQLLALMDSAAETEVGCMVCIEPTRNMSFNLRHQTRLVDASEFAISTLTRSRALSAVCTRVIMIFPTFSSTICPRSLTARI